MQSLTRRLESARLGPRPAHPVPIALAITDLDVGGAERALVNLALRLDRRRWAPVVIGLSGDGALAEPVRTAGIPCECLGLDRRRPLRGVARLASVLRRYRPVLVQSFMFHANLAVRLASPWAGRPWVVGGLRVAEREKRWHLTLDRLTSRLASGSVCVSEGVARFSREVGGLDPDRLTVIPNGIDPAPFDAASTTSISISRASLGVPDHAFLALTVGRLDTQKGLPDLLSAAEQVASARANWRLAIVGDGPHREWLAEQLATRPRLADRVQWLGQRTDVPGLMRSADLLVHPALWEGMPNVVLEGMAAGLPVVATAVEGSEDLVAPGRTGWLVPPRDPSRLARAIIEAVDDPEHARALGREGRARVEAEFSIARAVARYEALWSGLLGYEAVAPADD
ncbi:glycosyltransferase [Paludisphaera borealis]|uniref:GT4 family glycosyltransferase n=1 Tax=Paludisphaera borealis TaxID=1387353 RepID=A0A1U7CZ31_9BACT|nr:glycosyltransferase [Paludisphaera borealis]APW64129.1 GT4 family glycosyltransferase [Paludisphaera borealis]